MPTKETVYWHYEQRPRASTVIALRTVVPPAQLAGAIGAAIAALDPEVALYDAQTMDDRVASSLGAQRTPMVLALVFAGVAFASQSSASTACCMGSERSASARSACVWRSALVRRTSAA